MTLEKVNAWRNLGQYSSRHIDFYKQLYLNKLPRRIIQEIPERMKTLISVNGYNVWLPFEKPYHCQREYVAKVIETLTTGCNAMLESPTGTGKTISFLCAAVAFIKKAKERQQLEQQQSNDGDELPAPHTIVYCTRTHSQIQQVISEIKNKLPYKVSVQTLASKQHLCIMEDVKESQQGHILNHRCKMLKKSRRLDDSQPVANGDSWMEQEQSKQTALLGGTKRQLEPNLINEMHSACPFYLGEELTIPVDGNPTFRHKRFNPIIDMLDQRVHDSKAKEAGGDGAPQCLDIEDLLKEGKQHNLCPYYLAKSRLAGADIVVLPYQYLLTTHIKNKLQLNLKNAIVLFDEAHNIDNNCEDVLSFEFMIEHFWDAFYYLNAFSKTRDNDDYDAYSRRKKATHLKCFLMRLYNAIKSIDLSKKENVLGQVQKCVTGVYILELADFLEIFDKLLLDSGDSYDHVYLSDDDSDPENNMNLNRPTDENGEVANALTSRNFSKKQGHKVQEKELSDHEGPTFNESTSPKNGVKVTLNGQQYIKYPKPEEDVKHIELQKLMESAYSCFDNSGSGQECEGGDEVDHADFMNSMGNQEPAMSELPHLNTGGSGAAGGAQQTNGERSQLKGRAKVSKIIELLQTISRIKLLLKRQEKHAPKLTDFKFFIRTNKGFDTNKGRKRFSKHEKSPRHHMTQWGIQCLNPSYVFKQVANNQEERPLSVILTSGTLQPMKIIYQELQTTFKVKLVNEHFIDNSQVFATVVKEDFRGHPFKFNFENQDMSKSFRFLGLFLSKLAKTIKGGILMFFTSYTHIQDCYTQFSKSRFDFGKAQIFQECKNHQESMAQYESYKEQVRETNKGIMMCVSRGRLSEGLNFSDNLARACLVVGIPYLLVNDSRVNLKKKYVDQKNNQMTQIALSPDYTDPTKSRQYQDLTGDYWYKMTALREVNQIIGRCIRHQNDYASIFLIDERYERNNIKDKLSKWVRDRLRVFKRFEDLEEDLDTFFKQNSIKQCQRQVAEERQRVYAPKPIAETSTFQIATGDNGNMEDARDDHQDGQDLNLPAAELQEQEQPSSSQSSSSQVAITSGMLSLADPNSSNSEVDKSLLQEALLSSSKRDSSHPLQNFDLGNDTSLSFRIDEIQSILNNDRSYANDNNNDASGEVSVSQLQDLLSSQLDTQGLLQTAALLAEDSSILPNHEASRRTLRKDNGDDDDGELSDFAQSDLYRILFSQAAVASQAQQAEGMGDASENSISIGEETLAALDTNEKIHTSQLSFNTEDIQKILPSQMSCQEKKSNLAAELNSMAAGVDDEKLVNPIELLRRMGAPTQNNNDSIADSNYWRKLLNPESSMAEDHHQHSAIDGSIGNVTKLSSERQALIFGNNKSNDSVDHHYHNKNLGRQNQIAEEKAVPKTEASKEVEAAPKILEAAPQPVVERRLEQTLVSISKNRKKKPQSSKKERVPQQQESNSTSNFHHKRTNKEFRYSSSKPTTTMINTTSKGGNSKRPRYN